MSLPACQLVSGVSAALGLFATTAAFSAPIETADDSGRLGSTIPAVSVPAATAGLRALPGSSSRPCPTVSRPGSAEKREYRMLEAATNAEQAAYGRPGLNERYDAAERGVDVSRDMIGQSQKELHLLPGHPRRSGRGTRRAIPAVAVAAPAGGRSAGDGLDPRRMRHLPGGRGHAQGPPGDVDAAVAPDRQGTDRPGPHRYLGPLPPRQVQSRRRAGRDHQRPGHLGESEDRGGGSRPTEPASAVVWGAVLLLLLETGRISAASTGTAIFALRSARAPARRRSPANPPCDHGRHARRHAGACVRGANLVQGAVLFTALDVLPPGMCDVTVWRADAIAPDRLPRRLARGETLVRAGIVGP